MQIAADQYDSAPQQPTGHSKRWIDDRRWAMPVAIATWTLIVMMVVPDGFNYHNLSTSAAPSSGSAISRLLWLGLLGSGGLVLLWRSSLGWLLLRWVNPFFLAFAVLAFCSVLWSIEPGVSLRRMIRLFAVIGVSAMFVLLAWHRRRFQNVMRPLLTVLLAGSILFGLAFPHLGIHSESNAELAGAWRGLTAHKNSLGALASLGAILWFHGWLTREVRLAVALPCGLIAMTCLMLARSSTAVVTTLFVMMFLVMLLRTPQNLRRYMPWAVSLFVIALLTFAVAVLRLVPGMDVLLQPVVMLTGKDLTFTGRSEIWQIINEHIQFAPMLGSGYGAYWIGPMPHSPSYVFLSRMYFYPGSAHNGYLEVVNDLGFVGLACLLGYLFHLIAQSLRLLSVDRSQAALYLALFFQQAISNLSESHWLHAMSVDFAIVTLATFSLARDHLELRLRHYFGFAPPATPMPASAVVSPLSRSASR